MRVLVYQFEKVTLFDDQSSTHNQYIIARPTEKERRSTTFTARKTTITMWIHKLKLMKRLTRQAREEKCDLVLVETHEEGFAASLVFRLFGRGLKLGVLSLNLPRQHRGWKGILVRWAFHRVDLAFVHSRADLTELAGKLGLTAGQMAFRKYWRFMPEAEDIDFTRADEISEPYVLAYGATDRDYATYFRAMEKLSYHGVAVVRPWAVEGLSIPENVRVYEHLPLAQLDGLIARAEVCVIPLAGNLPSSGQIALLSAYRQGKPTICTEVRGIVDYLMEGAVITVKPADAEQLANSISKLMNDREKRNKLSANAKKVSETLFSAQAALREVDNAITSRFGAVS